MAPTDADRAPLRDGVVVAHDVELTERGALARDETDAEPDADAHRDALREGDIAPDSDGDGVPELDGEVDGDTVAD